MKEAVFHQGQQYVGKQFSEYRQQHDGMVDLALSAAVFAFVK